MLFTLNIIIYFYYPNVKINILNLKIDLKYILFDLNCMNYNIFRETK